MLSDVDIMQAMKSGDLVLEPFDKSQLRPAGVTLHLGHYIIRPVPGKVIDIKKDEVPKYEEHTLRSDSPYLLKPGEFVLAHTLEKLTLSNRLGAMIEGRSTLARLGISVVQTSMIIDAGVQGRVITLEIKNNGPSNIYLYPDMKIARMAFFELRTPSSTSYDETGRYRHQKDRAGRPILGNEFRA